MAKFAAGWRQVAIGALLLAVVSLIASTYSVISVPFAREFQPSRMVLMLAMTILSGASALLSPLLGGLMDRVPLKLLTTIGAILLVLGYFALSFVGSMNQVLVVFGVLIAPANVLLGPVAVTVLLSRWFLRKRGAAIGIAIAGLGVGGFLFPPLVQLLLNLFDWRTAMQLLALILGALLLPAVVLIVERPESLGLHPDGDSAEQVAARPAQPTELPSRLTILANRNFWVVTLFVTIVASGLKGMVTNLVPLATDAGIGANAAALLISIYSGCAMLGKLSFVGLADRLSPRTIAALSLGGFALGNLGMGLATGPYWQFAASVATIGYLGGFMLPLQSFLLPRILGQHVVGRVGGLMSLISLIALLTTPPLFGHVHDVTHSYAAVFLAFSAIAGLAILLVPALDFHRSDTASAG